MEAWKQTTTTTSSSASCCSWCCSDGAEEVDVVVVGAGVSGLAAARKLSESGLRTVVLEAQDKPGGRLCLREVEGFGRLHFGAQFIHGEDTLAFKWHKSKGWELIPEEFPRLLYTKDTGVIDVTQPVEDVDIMAALDALDALSADGDDGSSGSQDERNEHDDGHGCIGTDTCSPLLIHHLKEVGLSPRAQRIAEALLCSDRNCDLATATTDDCRMAEREWPHGVSDFWMPADPSYLYSLTQGVDIRCGHVVKSIADLEDRGGKWSTADGSSSRSGTVVVTAQSAATSSHVQSTDATPSTCTCTREQEHSEQHYQHAFRAHHVLVTCSVAVLQRGAIAFYPPLPSWKTAAIQSVAAPPVLKVFLRFSNAFWGDMHAIVCADGPAPELWAHEDGLPVVTCFLPARWRQEAINTDTATEQAQHQPPPSFDEKCWGGLRTWQRATVLRLLDQLGAVFPQAEPECLRALFVDWADVAHVWCGYAAPTGSAGARRRLQRRCGRVHFAGEATSSILDVSMQGAIATGEARAEDIITAVRDETNDCQ